MFFKDGAMIKKTTGYKDPKELRELITATFSDVQIHPVRDSAKIEQQMASPLNFVEERDSYVRQHHQQAGAQN